MKKVDLNFELKDLADNQIGNAGQVLAVILMAETKGDSIKFFDWSMSLHKLQSIEVDSSDLSKIKDVINNTERVTLLLKAQFLKYFETLK